MLIRWLKFIVLFAFFMTQTIIMAAEDNHSGSKGWSFSGVATDVFSVLEKLGQMVLFPVREVELNCEMVLAEPLLQKGLLASVYVFRLPDGGLCKVARTRKQCGKPDVAFYYETLLDFSCSNNRSVRFIVTTETPAGTAQKIEMIYWKETNIRSPAHWVWGPGYWRKNEMDNAPALAVLGNLEDWLVESSGNQNETLETEIYYIDIIGAAISILDSSPYFELKVNEAKAFTDPQYMRVVQLAMNDSFSTEFNGASSKIKLYVRNKPVVEYYDLSSYEYLEAHLSILKTPGALPSGKPSLTDCYQQYHLPVTSTLSEVKHYYQCLMNGEGADQCLVNNWHPEYDGVSAIQIIDRFAISYCFELIKVVNEEVQRNRAFDYHPVVRPVLLTPKPYEY